MNIKQLPIYYYCMMDGYPIIYAPMVYKGIPMSPMFISNKETRNKYSSLMEYMREVKEGFTTEEALKIGEMLGIDWSKSKFDVEQYRMGLDVELEHGRRDPSTDVTGDNPILTGKIALAHLNEFPDYYTRLSKMEEEAKAFWGSE